MDMVTHRFNDRIREDLARIALDKRELAEKNETDRKAAASGGDSQPAETRSGATDGPHLATA
jgi:hypothetical protein